ncbi:MAG: desulfoferrodoxin FeS4 iron-binding domain-containing protein [Clostridiaceae bacterium]|nr:desulfoferrodoxin FeS4 iron-binding domain-containing protein [Clostridiaceae bacterium]
MAVERKIFRCSICGNIVTLLHEGKGELVCCGEPMKRLIAGEDDSAAKEKHVPVVKVVDGKLRVDVGDVPHPMVPEHYIEFVILVTGTGFFVEFLDPGKEPVAWFTLPEDDDYEVFEYCNLHGLWKA